MEKFSSLDLRNRPEIRNRFYKVIRERGDGSQRVEVYASTERLDLQDPVFTPASIEEVINEGWTLDYDHDKCPKCGTEMIRNVKSYPPYCESTYEQHLCPNCGHGSSSSI